MNTQRSSVREFSRMQLAALAAVAVVLGSAGWQIYQYALARQGNVTAVSGRGDRGAQAADTDYGFFEAVSSPNATSSTPEEIAQVGPNIASQVMADYAVMSQEGSYTPQAAQQAGVEIAAATRVSVAHPLYDASTLRTTDDMSGASITRYQQAMAKALAPLSKNTRPEYEIYAYYVDTHDDIYLTQLRAVADNYRAAAGNATKVVVPTDMLTLHVGLLNSFQGFAAVLDALADNASNPITSAALLVSYNKAEDSLRTISSAYTSYYANK